jgi:hypothetical protein
MEKLARLTRDTRNLSMLVSVYCLALESIV